MTGQIVLLAFGAAFFPTLIACVAIMISRPSPRRLLLAFYLGGLIASLTSGLFVLSAFNDGNAVLEQHLIQPEPRHLDRGWARLAAALLADGIKPRQRTA